MKHIKKDQFTRLSFSKCQDMMHAPVIMCFSMIREHLDVLPSRLPYFLQNQGKCWEAGWKQKLSDLLTNPAKFQPPGHLIQYLGNHFLGKGN